MLRCLKIGDINRGCCTLPDQFNLQNIHLRHGELTENMDGTDVLFV